jgi:hypothetical protein
MKIETEFNIGDLLVNKHTSDQISVKLDYGSLCEYRIFKVMEIKSVTCYGGTQVFYECRPLHLIFRKKDEDFIFINCEAGFMNDGKITITFRADEVKHAPKHLAANINP